MHKSLTIFIVVRLKASCGSTLGIIYPSGISTEQNIRDIYYGTATECLQNHWIDAGMWSSDQLSYYWYAGSANSPPA